MELLKSFFQPNLDLTHQEISPEKISPGAIMFESHCISRLIELPSELLLQICDILSPVDLACLCLCNHRLYTLFKRYYRFPTLRDDKLSIFIRLERDFPEYFSCDICNILHRYDGSESFGLSGISHNRSSRLPCIRKGYDFPAEYIGGSSISNMRSHREFKSRLSFLQVKLAMRRYLYGPQFGINTDSLAFTQVCQYRNPWENPVLSELINQTIRVLFSIDAQICSEPLGVHIRLQNIVVYDVFQEDPNHIPDDHWWSSFSPFFDICAHTNALESKLEFSDIKSIYNGRNDSFPYHCPRCNTVSLIEFRRIDSRLTLIRTRWINLGPGIHREDPLWKIHTLDSTLDYGMMPDQLPSSLMLQNPRTCFENTSSLSFEDFRSRNIAYLRGDRFKNGEPFAFEGGAYGPVWHISYKEPSRKG